MFHAFHALHPRFTLPAAGDSPKPGDNGKAQAKNAEPTKATGAKGKFGQTPDGNGQAGANPSAAASNPATSDGRDAKGRGAIRQGNTEGFGNPFSRQVGDARKVVLDCATDEELRAVTKAMLDKAKKGDVAAARLIYEYTIGKPAQAVEPDRLARDEMEFFKDAAKMFGEAVRIVDSVEPWFPLTMLRTCWPEVTKSVRDYMVPQLRKGLPGYDENGQPLPGGDAKDKAAPVTADNGGQTPTGGGKPQPVTEANGGGNAGSAQGARPVTVANGRQGPTGGGKPRPVTVANGGGNGGSTQGARPVTVANGGGNGGSAQGARPVTVANGGQGPAGGGKPQPVTVANGGQPSANRKSGDVGG